MAAVTSVLHDVLANGLIRYASATQLGDVNVSVLPPDRIAAGADQPNQLNICLYRVEPQIVLTAAAAAGGSRRRELGLKLHYLVTAYSSQDYMADILLGCAVHMFGGLPVLTAAAASGALEPPATRHSKSSRSPVREALATADVFETSERVLLSQEFLSLDDTSKLWGMLQAKYRPSATYEVAGIRMSIDG
jgi:hypothetical protein